MAINGNGRSDSERQVFETELLKLMPFTRAFARSLTHNQEMANDLAQEAITKALKARDTFIVGTNLKAWLFTILRNQFYGQRRRAWRQVPWDQEVAVRIPDLFPGNPEVRLDLSRTLLCMSYLSQEQRDVVVGVGLLGMAFKDIGIACNCAIGTGKSRLSRGRKALGALIDDASIREVNVRALEDMLYALPVNHRLYSIRTTYHDALTAYAAIGVRQ